jgi:hypothetical protein
MADREEVNKTRVRLDQRLLPDDFLFRQFGHLGGLCD